MNYSKVLKHGYEEGRNEAIGNFFYSKIILFYCYVRKLFVHLAGAKYRPLEVYIVGK